MNKVVATPNQMIKHQGEKLYPIPCTYSAEMAEYIVRMEWGAITPDAEPVDDLSHLTVPAGVVNNKTGKPVF